MTQTIRLANGADVLLDDADYEVFSGYSWHFASDGYVARTDYANGGKREVLLHREIMQPPKGALVDHANRSRLDNRRANLRLCTKAQNAANQSGSSKRRSRFKGVTLRKRNKPWEARIKVAGVGISLGHFASDVEAASAYDAAALKHFGPFAGLNFPTQAVA